jgi:hypothetical protein
VKVFLFAAFLPSFVWAGSLECARVKVAPSSVCANLKATLDLENCESREPVQNSRVECKNEFFAEFVFEMGGATYRAPLTKNADSTWSAGEPVGQTVEPASAVRSHPVLVEQTTVLPTPTNVKFWAQFRARAEKNTKRDLATDKSPTYLRLRPGLEWMAQPKLSLVAEVQASKAYGEESYSPSSSSSNSRVRTSGYNSDSRVDLHQGYIKYLPASFLDIRVGRRALNYGDGLLVGNSDWDNVGRSFDSASARFQYHSSWLEAFTAKLVDRSVSADQPGDEDLSGVYLHYGCEAEACRGRAGDIDAYVFNYQNSTNVDAAGNAAVSRMYEVWTYGTRATSEHDAWDLRWEYAFQTASVSADQLDGEVGYRVKSLKNSRLALRFFSAGEDFNQLFPSGHARFGAADLFSRRNILGYALQYGIHPTDDLGFTAAYFWLNRRNDTKAGFFYDGTPMGTTSASAELGQELDLELTYQPEKELTLLLGYADFKPGNYISDQYPGMDPSRWYLQLTAMF